MILSPETLAIYFVFSKIGVALKRPYAEESYGFNSHSNETFVPIPISSGNEFT